MKTILVVDDELGSRVSLAAVLSPAHRVVAAASAAEASAFLGRERPDLLLLDVMMPDKDGVTFLREVQQGWPELPVVMISASTRIRPAVDAIQSGALDYVTKPFDVDDLRRVVARALERSRLHRQVEAFRTDLEREYPVDRIVGRAPSFLRTVEEARQAARTDATVLICGESGTGKELIARLVHDASARRDEPFVAIHCGALPENLMESELFGFEKGAFTGADRRKPGRFELAGAGTIFLDEIGEMAAATQVKLLRVLQEREYMRLGGTQLVRAEARVVAATHKDLAAERAAGRFREDLYYRLHVVPIILPPLRERREDIPLLARHFLALVGRAMDAAAEDFSPEIMEIFQDHPWPGNVRDRPDLPQA